MLISCCVFLCGVLTDVDRLRIENKQLQKDMEMLQKDYQAEMENLEKENEELKSRALREQEAKEKALAVVKEKEREIVGLQDELKLIKARALEQEVKEKTMDVVKEKEREVVGLQQELKSIKGEIDCMRHFNSCYHENLVICIYYQLLIKHSHAIANCS